MGALFQFFGCSQLRNLWINIPNETLQGIAQSQVISSESLVELDYNCNMANPFLRLSCLRFRVSSMRPRQMDGILPYSSHALLEGATNMVYYSNQYSLQLYLSRNGVNLSLSMSPTVADHTTADWFSDETCIQFSRIEELTVEGCSFIMGFPVNIFTFDNLRVLQITPWDVQLTERFLQLLHPDIEMEIPYRSLQEIEYWGSPMLFLRLLISLVKERSWLVIS